MSCIPLSPAGHSMLHSRLGKKDIRISQYPEDMLPESYKNEKVYYEVFELAGYKPTYMWEQFREGFE